MFFSLTNEINEIFAFNILAWELIFIAACTAFFTLLLYLPSRAFDIAPILTTIVLIYFFVSFVCEKLKQSFGEIGNSLYLSKWYLLKPCDRKDFLTILVLGKHLKTVKVGPFGFAGLERFSQALSVVYQICLMIKNLVTIQKFAKM